LRGGVDLEGTAEVGTIALGLYLEDPVTSDADGIVVPENRDFDMDQGIAAALRDAAGPEPEIQAMYYGRGEVGGTVLTRPGLLRTKRLIHTVAVDDRGILTEESLRAGIAAAMDACMEKNLPTVLFPDFGDSWPGLSPMTRARITVETVAKALNERFPAMESIVFSVLPENRIFWRIALNRLAGKPADWSKLPKSALVCGVRGIRKGDVMRTILEGATTPEEAMRILGMTEVHQGSDCGDRTATGDPCSIGLPEVFRTYFEALQSLSTGYGSCGNG
jgi:O-acetyl-ADP-ribose deacetylase (regulator of RNase III)